MNLSSLPILMVATSLAIPVFLTSCQAEKAEPESVVEDTQTAAVTKVDYTSYGVAALVPAKADAFVKVSNLSQHLSNLQKSNWWSQLLSMITEQAPDKQNSVDELRKSGEQIDALQLKELFLFAGDESVENLLRLSEIYKIHSVVDFTKSLLGADEANSDLEQDLWIICSNNNLYEQLHALIQVVECPEWVLGVNAGQGAEDFKSSVEKKLQLLIEEQKLEVGAIETASGTELKRVTLRLEPWITKLTQDTQVPTGASDAIVARYHTLIQDLKNKTLDFCWGDSDGYFIVALGHQLQQVAFGVQGEQSLALDERFKRLEFLDHNKAVLTSHLEKEVVGILYDPQPLTSRVSPLAQALKESDSAEFKALGSGLEQGLMALANEELEISKGEITDLDWALTYDQGLRWEVFGGRDTTQFVWDRPSQFSNFLQQDGLMIGAVKQSEPEFLKKLNTFVPKVLNVFYQSAKAFTAQSEQFKNFQQQVAFFELLVLPQLTNLYQSYREFSEEGVGAETAWLVTEKPAQGESQLQGVDFSWIFEVKNRAIIESVGLKLAALTDTVTTMLVGLNPELAAKHQGGFKFKHHPELSEAGFDFYVWNADKGWVMALNDKHFLIGSNVAYLKQQIAQLAEGKVGETVGMQLKADPLQLVASALSHLPLSDLQKQHIHQLLQSVEGLEARSFNADDVLRHQGHLQLQDTIKNE